MAPLVALMLVPILGATALAVDAGYWYYKQRDMQNAADSAAIAGARTPDEDPAVDATNDNYVNVAKGTAAKYGYVDGDGTVTVAVSRVQCPSEADPTKLECTQVVIGYTSPLFFSPIVGFQGNKNGAQGVAALAVAGDQTGEGGYEGCIRTLATDGVGFLGNGNPFANLHGCAILSNSAVECNGAKNSAEAGIGAGAVIAAGEIKGQCTPLGGTQLPRQTDLPEDPYKDLAENIPDDPCDDTYYQATENGNKLEIGNAANTLNDASTLSGEVKICGDVLLDSDVTLNGATLVIYNGRLITQDNTLTANNSTIIFSGSNDTNYFHYPSDALNPSNKSNGVLEIAAPTSVDNPWQGIAIYQDPALTTNVDIREAGNAPALNITGVFYTPNATVTLSGVVNKAGSGYKCFVLVSYRVRIDGTGEVFKDGMVDQCDVAGVDLPTYGATVNKWLVK